MTDTKDFAVINLSAVDESPAFPKVTINRTGGWVAFGDKNLFPQEIINANSKSPVNSAIIQSTVTYICGKGIRDSEANADKYVGVPNASESWDEMIEKIARDYKTFGGFYFQVVLNKGGSTVSLFHQDFSTVRIGIIDEKGHPQTFKISNDWTKTCGKNKPVELKAWPGMDNAAKGEAYLYNYWDYVPGLLFYSLPEYYPAIEYIKADGSLGAFYNNAIDNGFTPSAILTFSSNPGEDKKKAFEQNLRAAFCGSKGANSLVTVWGENGDVKTNVNAFNSSSNADVYNNVEGIIFQKIISANRLSSPTLAGVSGTGNLSGNAAEIIDAYVLYSYTVVAKLRTKILDHLNKFTKINKTAPLVIEELDVLPKIRETESETPGAGDEGESNEAATPPATLSRKSTLQKLIAKLWKYDRREMGPDGKYRYYYDEDKPSGGNGGGESKKKLLTNPVKSKTAEVRAKHLNEMRPLLKKRVRKTVDGKDINVGFTPDGNRHLYSDTFRRSKSLKKEDLKNIDKALGLSIFVKSSPITKPRKDNITKFYYFKDSKREQYYNVAEERIRKRNGSLQVKHYLYSVTDKIK